MYLRQTLRTLCRALKIGSRTRPTVPSRPAPRLEALEDRRLLSAASADVVIPPGVKPDNVAGGIVRSAEALYDEVAADYQHFLGRAPDAKGMAYWVSCRAAGMTAEQLEAMLVSSLEYRGRHEDTHDAWVRSLFQDVLGRPGQETEVKAAVVQLDQGASFVTVASELTACREHENQLVAGYYQHFLGRTPSQAELKVWVDQIVNGSRTQEDVKAAFLLSDEYLQSHTPAHYQAQHVADPEAIYSYGSYLMAGTGPGDRYLTEHGGDSVDWLFGAYHDVLGRQPEVTGLNVWLNTLGSNTRASESAGMSGLTKLS
jgi:hypothetical protein